MSSQHISTRAAQNSVGQYRAVRGNEEETDRPMGQGVGREGQLGRRKDTINPEKSTGINDPKGSSRTGKGKVRVKLLSRA